jgi:hypothetical protein
MLPVKRSNQFALRISRKLSLHQKREHAEVSVARAISLGIGARDDVTGAARSSRLTAARFSADNGLPAPGRELLQCFPRSNGVRHHPQGWASIRIEPLILPE